MLIVVLPSSFAAVQGVHDSYASLETGFRNLSLLQGWASARMCWGDSQTIRQTSFAPFDPISIEDRDLVSIASHSSTFSTEMASI